MVLKQQFWLIQELRILVLITQLTEVHDTVVINYNGILATKQLL